MFNEYLWRSLTNTIEPYRPRLYFNPLITCYINFHIICREAQKEWFDKQITRMQYLDYNYTCQLSLFFIDTFYIISGAFLMKFIRYWAYTSTIQSPCIIRESLNYLKNLLRTGSIGFTHSECHTKLIAG